MSKRWLLDLFCGAGGASVGYHRAGFEVVGVDLHPQPDYPFEFWQADALTFDLTGFDAVHASPPCQLHTRAKHLRVAQGGESKALDLVEPTRARLRSLGVPYVIENVPGAPLHGVTLCGSSFGLKVRRHRVFESNVYIPPLACDHRAQRHCVRTLGLLCPGSGLTPKQAGERDLWGTNR